MSDAQPAESNETRPEPAPTQPQTTGKSSPLRLILLLGALALACAGLAYDYQVARPQFAKAQETMKGIVDGTIPDPSGDGTYSNEELCQLLGREPSGQVPVPEGKSGTIEVFSWRSGFPLRQYKIYVVFSGLEPAMYDYSVNQLPDDQRLPPSTKLDVKTLTQEELDNWVPAGKISSAGSGGGIPKPGRPGKRKSKTKEEPTKEEPTKEEPSKEEPTKEEPTKEEPTKEEPAKEEPAKEEPAKEEPAKEEPTKEEPTKEEPTKEEPTKEEPAKEEPAKGDTDPPKTDDPVN